MENYNVVKFSESSYKILYFGEVLVCAETPKELGKRYINAIKSVRLGIGALDFSEFHPAQKKFLASRQPALKDDPERQEVIEGIELGGKGKTLAEVIIEDIS